jgi:hypothetical protein
MARPRKYETDVEAKAARKAKDAERKRKQRAATHAKKSDPARRSDARVNQQRPAAKLDNAISHFINCVLPIAADTSRFDEAFAIIIWWERRHGKRLPYLPLPYLNGRPSFSGDEWVWNRFLSTIRIALSRNPGSCARTQVSRIREIREDLAQAAGMPYAAFMETMKFFEANRRRREGFENSPKVRMERLQYKRSEDAVVESLIFKKLARNEHFGSF